MASREASFGEFLADHVAMRASVLPKPYRSTCDAINSRGRDRRMLYNSDMFLVAA
jgi:hypothetical protein